MDEDYGKTSDHLIADDDTNGFYAAYIQAGSWGTIGGALTDYDFHVLDTMVISSTTCMPFVKVQLHIVW